MKGLAGRIPQTAAGGQRRANDFDWLRALDLVRSNGGVTPIALPHNIRARRDDMKANWVSIATLSLGLGPGGFGNVGVAQTTHDTNKPHETKPADPAKPDQAKPDQAKPQETKESKEGKVPLEKVPDPVRKTILEQAKGGTVEKVEQKLDKDGKTIFDATVKSKDGKSRDLQVDSAGKLIELEKP